MSQSVSFIQASEMAGVCVVLQTVADPLCLSLALDIMEEVLGSGDRRRYGRLMAREGALAALVCCPASHRPAGLFNSQQDAIFNKPESLRGLPQAAVCMTNESTNGLSKTPKSFR